MRPLFLYAPNLKKYETDFLSSRDGWSAISVTGTACAFNCKHCGRAILRGMTDGSSEERLIKALEASIRRGHKGVILSGGSTARGEVPIWRFKGVLQKYRDSLTFIAHTGIVRSEEIAREFREAGVKVALLDMVGDNETIKEVLGQPFTVEDYLNSFKLLKRAGLKVVPHVIVGLSVKGLEGDLRSLELLKEVSPDAVIVVGLMPLSVNFSRQASPEGLMATLKKARDEFSVPVMLGCARPRGGEYLKVEQFAVDYDVDGIAFPEEETVGYAQGKRQIVFSNACCANVVFDVLGVVA
jgi:uncharacterized radical SAM superfamily protein